MSGPLQTFGSSPAAETLYKIVKDDEKALRTVSRFLDDTAVLYKLIPNSPLSTVISLVHIVRDHRLAHLEKLNNIPKDAMSFIRNVLHIKFNEKLKRLRS